MRPRVKLFSLPPWILSCPPISLPVLAAACRTRGIELRCCDGNLLFYEYLLRPEFLRACVERLRPAALAADGQRELLLRTRLAVAERTLPSLPGLHRRIRQTDPEDPARWSYLLNTLDTLFQLTASATGVGVNRDTLQLPLEAATLGELVEHACSEPWPLVDGFLESELLPRVDGSETAVGLSVHTQEHMYVAARFAALLKRHFPALPVVAGGTFLTTYAPRWRQFGAAFRVFDYVVVNDGEEALPALLHALAAGSDPGDVPNLVWRSGGDLRANPARFVALADYPEPPDYSDLDLGQYHSPRPLASIPIARGCFYDCAYCNYPSVGGQRFRVDPARSVVDKVARLSERYGIDSFFFSVAVLPPPLARRLAEALLERGLQVRWATGARFERGFTPELCALLERSGCTRIDFGAESGHAGVLERMHKRLSIEDYRCALENFAGTGINRHFYMIMNFPGETLEEFGSSVEFVQRAAPQLCSFNFFSYQLAPVRRSTPTRPGTGWLSPGRAPPGATWRSASGTWIRSVPRRRPPPSWSGWTGWRWTSTRRTSAPGPGSTTAASFPRRGCSSRSPATARWPRRGPGPARRATGRWARRWSFSTWGGAKWRAPRRRATAWCATPAPAGRSP